MDGVTLLRRAREAGLALSAAGDKLVICGPRRAEALAQLLIENKPSVLAILRSTSAKAPAEWVVGAAKLRAMSCPAMVPAVRWAALVRDTDRFLASEWVGKAAALEWDTASLFMCHARRPVERYDCRGALWGVAGGDVIALTETAIMVHTPTTRTKLACYRPRPARGEPVVMAWELTDATESPAAA